MVLVLEHARMLGEVRQVPNNEKANNHIKAKVNQLGNEQGRLTAWMESP